LAVTVATVLLLGCQQGSDDAEPRPPRTRADVPTTVERPGFDAIEDALRGPGNLVVCGRDSQAGDASGSYERRTLTVAAGTCPSAEADGRGGAVVVNAYDSTLIRDQGAVTDFGDRLVAWTYLQFVVFVTDSSSAPVLDGVETAMASLGAQKTYDERGPATSGG
jgi:hypothetical protein